MKKLGSTLTEKSALRKWDKLCNTIYSTALNTFGKKTSKTCDWFDSKANVMMPVIVNKQSALHLQYINLPKSKNLQTLKDAKRKYSKQPEDVWTNSGLNLVKRFNLLQILKIFLECTTASNKLYDQPREWPLI